MSLLKYFSRDSRESDIDRSTVSGGTDDGSDAPETDAEDEREQSLEDDVVGERLTGAVSSGSSSLPDISESEDDPSLPLPVDCRLKDVRIRQGPYRPVLSKYKVTIHRGKCRSFCSKWYDFHDWLEYSPKVDKMFCFVCRVFAHKVIGNVGRVDPAFTTSGTQASRWKDARKVLSRHQASAIHKQAVLCQKDFETVTPISLQLDKAAADEASRLKQQQERNRQILYRIINVVIVLAKTGHPLRGHREGSDSHNRGLFLEITHLLAQYDPVLSDHFQNGPKNATYVSNTIQNELIAALYQNIIEERTKERTSVCYVL